MTRAKGGVFGFSDHLLSYGPRLKYFDHLRGNGLSSVCGSVESGGE